MVRSNFGTSIGLSHPHRHAATTIVVLGALVSFATGAPHARPGSASSLMVEDVYVSPHGDMVRRESTAPAGLVQTVQRDPADIKADGLVTVVSPAQTQSEQLKLEEMTEECMQSSPTAECMEKFGSYGIHKMFTESWANVHKLGYRRVSWMSHPEVQKRRLFELTLPGTVSSGSYAITGEDAAAAGVTPYGVVSQNFDFYQQLELGVRLFDIRVAYSSETSLVYISHGSLMIPLATALQDIKRFLSEHEREVIVLDVKKDDNADVGHLRPLVEEENTNTRIPGQLVHEAVKCELGEMLATYKVLAKLPLNEPAENPTVGALTDLGAHVIYFWDTQQVLCTNFQECMQTPGWHPADRKGGSQFAFGRPFEMGKRINVTGGRQTARMIEPACHTHSRTFTKTDQPEQLLSKIKIYTNDMAAKTLESRPKCFPPSAPLPKLHEPTLFYTIDAFVVSTPEEQAVQSDRMRGVKAIYTRGEGFTVKTDAERTNYLVLNWLLKKDNREVYSKPNAIMFEFAGAAYMPILRIIEAQQMRPDCGWAIYCKDSGSCWADTLLDSTDKCLDEAKVLAALKEHADEKGENTVWVLYLTLIGVSCILVCGLATCGGYLAQMFNPKKPKEAEQGFAEDDASSVHSALPGSEAASDYGDLPPIDDLAAEEDNPSARM